MLYSVIITLNQECNSLVAQEKYPNRVNRMSELEEQIKGGTTVAVVVIKHDKLYVANVGDTRVLFCLYDQSSNYVLVDQVRLEEICQYMF